MQRERSESRLRNVASDEIARALEQVGIDIRTAEGRRELRTRLDYLDRLFDDQSTNRAALDWSREMMARTPSPRAIFDWAAGKMEVEKSNRETVRKTLLDKLISGVMWLLTAGAIGAVLNVVATKGHMP